MWLAAWKLVSNDAKRTVAPPNAKHSTLLQGCFFMFLFLIPFTIRQQSIIYPHKFSTDPVFWGSGGNMQIGLWSLGVRAQPYGMGVGDMFVTFALPSGGAICGSRAQL